MTRKTDAFPYIDRLRAVKTESAPHHLRHTYASQALAAGESIYYVQKQLGHAQIHLTVDLYGSWLPAGSAETAARIEARALGVVTYPVTSGGETGSPAGGGRRVKR